MSFKRLAEFERHKREVEAAEREKRAKLELRKAVKDALPASLKVPKRGRGRAPSAGVSRKEVALLRGLAEQYMDGEVGRKAMEAAAQRTAIVMLLIDGLLGTEPWRAAGGPHGGLIAANARVRYMENAVRILEDMRRSAGAGAGPSDRLLEGVIDAERT